VTPPNKVLALESNMPAFVDVIVPVLVMPPRKRKRLGPSRPMPVLAEIVPLFVQPAINFPVKSNASIPAIAAVMVPLLVMPPANSEDTWSRYTPLSGAEMVPLLMMPPKKFDTFTTRTAVLPVDTSAPLLTMPPSSEMRCPNIGTALTIMVLPLDVIAPLLLTKSVKVERLCKEIPLPPATIVPLLLMAFAKDRRPGVTLLLRAESVTTEFELTKMPVPLTEIVPTLEIWPLMVLALVTFMPVPLELPGLILPVGLMRRLPLNEVPLTVMQGTVLLKVKGNGPV